MSRMNWSMSLALATAGVSVALAGLGSSPAEAAIIRDNFRVDMSTGFLADQSFFGSFTYDDAALTDPSFQMIDPTNGNLLIDQSNGLLDLSFKFLGSIYTQSNDGEFPEFPKLNFQQDGVFQGLDFIVSEFFPNSTVIPGSIFQFETGFNPVLGSFFRAFKVEQNTLFSSQGKITYGVQPIPTPALLPGLIGLGMAALRKRRQNQSV